MSSRLESALRELTVAQIEELTARAEEWAAQNRSAGAPAPRRMLSQNWAGGLRDEPETSGLDAQASATRQWIKTLNQGSPR